MSTYSLPGDFIDPLKINDIVTDGEGTVVNTPFSINDVDFTVIDGPTSNTIYVDYQTGVDTSNFGFDPASPVKTLQRAITVADSGGVPITIQVNDEWIGVLSLTQTGKNRFEENVKIVSGHSSGRTIITSMNEDDVANRTWTNNGDGTFSCDNGNVADYNAAFDRTVVDEDGIATPMLAASTLAECQSTPGSFFWDGIDTLTVHMLDNSEPDERFIYCPSSGTNKFGFNFSGDGLSIILQGFIVYGQQSLLIELDGSSTISGDRNRGGIKDCWVVGSNGQATAINNWEAFVFDGGGAKYTRGDAIDYDAGAGDGRYMTVYEIGVKTYKASGYNENFKNQAALGESSNASTAHDNMNIVRVSCNYQYNYGPIVSDIATDAWLFCCYADYCGTNTSYYRHQGTAPHDHGRMVIIECDGGYNAYNSATPKLFDTVLTDVDDIIYRRWLGGTITTTGDVSESFTIGNVLVNVLKQWRGAVEPAETNASGNELKSWRGAVEPVGASSADALIGDITRSVTRGITRNVTEDWDWGA